MGASRSANRLRIPNACAALSHDSRYKRGIANVQNVLNVASRCHRESPRPCSPVEAQIAYGMSAHEARRRRRAPRRPCAALLPVHLYGPVAPRRASAQYGRNAPLPRRAARSRRVTIAVAPPTPLVHSAFVVPPPAPLCDWAAFTRISFAQRIILPGAVFTCAPGERARPCFASACLASAITVYNRENNHARHR